MKAYVALLVALAVALVGVFLDRQPGEIWEYRGNGSFMREAIAWDQEGSRFLVSRIEGGISQLVKQGDGSLKEELIFADDDVKGNATLGIAIDSSSNRLLAVHTDLLGKKFAALAAYDLRNSKRLFLTQLESSGEALLADDVAVDSQGNSYVTDAAGNGIWKVSPKGELISTIRSSVFTSKPNRLPFSLVGLNGIVYHPDGFLLVVHTWCGALFKVSLDGSSVSVVDAPLLVRGDGMKLLSPDKLVVAGIPGAKLVESSDGWSSARVRGRAITPFYRLPTAVAIKDGKPFVSHGFGWRSFLIKEAIF